jgi:stage II sporulation protein D
MKKVFLLSVLLSALALALTIAASTRGETPSAPPHTDTPAPGGGEESELRTSPPTEIPAKWPRDADVQVRVRFGEDVRIMRLDEYLVGVVAGEMPESFEMEALRAQAVAARTMVRYRMTVSPTPHHSVADVCADPGCCMAYYAVERPLSRDGDGYAENMGKIQSAVRSTDGVCVTFGGEPILAVFHSSSAGRTEDSASVWGGALPYLVSVDSPDTPANNPKYTAVIAITPEDFQNAVSSAYPGAELTGDAARWITDITYTPGGRIAALTIGGARVPGTHLRSMFGLASTAVEVSATGDSVVFVTKGCGHGVGMSQYGANSMAVAGASFGDILRAYYTGAALTDGAGSAPPEAAS